ncbi:hypothetical protein DFH27DRAFT_508858 [Peziza echinospora]|nr:hypothetical protein DFH27DRAFT_508858 [Peziza echinospora]
MPFPFTLSTTSTASFANHYTSAAYPSLPLACSTHRGILRDALKAYKRVPASAQGAHIKHITAVTSEYLSYLLHLIDAVRTGDATPIPGAPVLSTSWRPTLAASSTFGGLRQQARKAGEGLQYELFWVLLTLACSHTIQARALLMEFLTVPPSSSGNPVDSQSSSSSSSSALLPQATKHLLTSASIFSYMLTLTPPHSSSPTTTTSLPIDISPPLLSALSLTSLSSATLLAVLKSDPYPTYLALSTSATSKEYLYSAPAPPTGVKALLFSRLCIAASEHAAKAQGAISGIVREGKVCDEYIRYLDELRRVGRARGCRFLGLDAEAQSRLGEGLGWMKLASEILTGEEEEQEEESNKKKKKKKSSSMDPCTLHSELQTILALAARWAKTNDKLIFDRIPPTNSLMGRIPSGREVHSVPEFVPDRLGVVEVGELRRGGGEGGSAGGRSGGGGGGEGYVERWGEGTETARDSSDDEDGGASARSRGGMPGAYY